MSEVVPDSHQEFWRPPIIAQSLDSALAIAPAVLNRCGTCQTEFMPGARFCYLCGAVRSALADDKSVRWSGHFNFLRVLGFQHIKQGLGLPMASLIGFFAGISCLVAALAVGRVLSVQTAAEFQAVQFLRIEWLLGSLAAFLVAVLFKCASADRPQ